MVFLMVSLMFLRVSLMFLMVSLMFLMVFLMVPDRFLMVSLMFLMVPDGILDVTDGVLLVPTPSLTTVQKVSLWLHTDRQTDRQTDKQTQALFNIDNLLSKTKMPNFHNKDKNTFFSGNKVTLKFKILWN